MKEKKIIEELEKIIYREERIDGTMDMLWVFEVEEIIKFCVKLSNNTNEKQN
jgi:hypothetical protein